MILLLVLLLNSAPEAKRPENLILNEGVVMAKEFESTTLTLRRPAPTKIEIAQEACVRPIAQTAEEVEILPEKVEFHCRALASLGDK